MAKKPTPNTPQALKVKQRLLEAFGYPDGRVKSVERMTTWQYGPGEIKYWTQSYANLTVQPDGKLILRVNRAPADAEVEKLVGELGGTVTRGRGEVQEVRLTVTVEVSETGAELDRLAEAFAGVPSRRVKDQDANNHFYFEGPKAADYIRKFREVLTQQTP